MALAASADARWSAWAAPNTVAAPWTTSPANCRKKRRRARSAPLPGGVGAGASASVRVGSVTGVGRWRAGWSGRSVLDDACHAPVVEPLATLEELELDEERQADALALQTLDQLDRALHRATGRQQVIDDEHLLPRLDRIAMDLERVGAVLQRVFDGDRLGRQLAELADRDQARVELVGHR